MELSVNSPVSKYHQLGVETSVEAATPHQLVNLLFKGAGDRIRQAQGCMARRDIEGRCKAINACVEILMGLQMSLDHEKGGEIAANLDGLYDYMQRRLYRANADDDAGPLAEVSDLLNILSSAWHTIDPEKVQARQQVSAR